MFFQEAGVSVSLAFLLFASFLACRRLVRFRPKTEQRAIGPAAAEPLWLMAFASLLYITLLP